jgi:hypothetical protein
LGGLGAAAFRGLGSYQMSRYILLYAAWTGLFARYSFFHAARQTLQGFVATIAADDG